MCRHKGYTPSKEEHINRWNLEDSSRNYAEDVYYATSYMQSALTAGLPVIMRNDAGKNISVDAFWGILPVWKKDFKEAVTAAASFVNARSETVHEGTLYPPLLNKKQRCLIPCSYYFEHHHFSKLGKKGQVLEAKLNVPFVVKVVHRPIFSIPALYSHWYDKENKRNILTYSMLTIVANDKMMEVHNGDDDKPNDNKWRMPLVIDREMEERWLNPESSKKDIDDILNQQIHSEALNVHAVAPLTGKKAKRGEAILEEEFWDRKEEIEEIKNAGNQKTRANAMQPA